MDIQNSKFIQKYKEEALQYALFTNPDLDKNKFLELLDMDIMNKINILPVELRNTYKGLNKESNTLEVLDFLEDKHPIITEKGSLYKQHKDARNPNAEILEEMGIKRKAIKKQMLKAGEEFGKLSEQFIRFNIAQNGEKKDMNSYYGGSGAPSCIFYNRDVAISVTAKGQSLISNAMCSFEKFLAGNTFYLSVDEAISHIMELLGTLSKDFDITQYINTSISKNDLYNRIISQIYVEDENYQFTPTPQEEYRLRKLINSMSDDQVTKLYYKNNLVQFLRDSRYCRNLIRNTLYTMGELNEEDFKIVDSKGKINYRIPTETNSYGEFKLFMDANEAPEIVKVWVDELKYLIELAVMDYTPSINRINNLVYRRRQRVITIDTDSNFINLDEFYNFVREEIIEEESPIVYNLNDTEERICIVNLMAHICTYYISNALYTMVKSCNVEDDNKAKIIQMKNEFLMKRVLTTDAKKNYASLVLSQEGALLNPPFLDIKGLQLIKTVTNPEVSQMLIDILEEDILKSNKIDIGLVINKVKAVEDLVIDSIKKETRFLKPAKVNHPNAYSDPLRMAGIRGCMTWDLLYPETPIQLPNNVKLLRLKLGKLIDAQPLSETHPEIYEKLYKEVYNNKNTQISSYGVKWIAIPEDVDIIPEWTHNYIDYDTIINDSISAFLPVFSSLGGHVLPTLDSNTVYSNIIDF